MKSRIEPFAPKSLEGLRNKHREILSEKSELLDLVRANLQSVEYTKLMAKYQKLVLEETAIVDLIKKLERTTTL